MSMVGNGTLKVVQMAEADNEGPLCFIQGSLAIVLIYRPMVSHLQCVK